MFAQIRIVIGILLCIFMFMACTAITIQIKKKSGIEKNGIELSELLSAFFLLIISFSLNPDTFGNIRALFSAVVFITSVWIIALMAHKNKIKRMATEKKALEEREEENLL